MKGDVEIMTSIVNSIYGASLVSKNIYDRKGKLKWCVRENSIRDVDNGWRFLSDIDTDEYLANVDNWCVLPFESIIEIEPAVLVIYDMQVGTELTLVQEDKRKFFVDSNTGREVLYKGDSD